MTDKAWKAFERRIAKKIGTAKRVGATGGATPDVIATINNKEVAIEAKLLSNIPVFVKNILKQATNNAKGKMPLCIIKEKGAKDSDALVFTSLKTFLLLLEVRDKND